MRRLNDRPLVADEVLPELPSGRSMRPLVGVAVAASVALLAIFGLQIQSRRRRRRTLRHVPASVAEVARNDLCVTGPQPVDDQLRQYVMSHGASSSELGGNSMNARLVTLRLSEEALAEEESEDEADDEAAADELPRNHSAVIVLQSTCSGPCSMCGQLLRCRPRMAERVDPNEWLSRMGAAVQTTSYEGTVIRIQDGKAEALKVVHTVSDGVIREKVVAQEGNGLEIIRNGNEVHCILPDRKSVLVEEWDDQSTLFSTLPSSEVRFGSEYDVSIVREERVAGRQTILVGDQAA